MHMYSSHFTVKTLSKIKYNQLPSEITIIKGKNGKRAMTLDTPLSTLIHHFCEGLRDLLKKITEQIES